MIQRLPNPADLPEGDTKARAALDRYRFQRVTEGESPDFAEAYGALWNEFGERGELERRDVVRGWLANRPSYHLYVACDSSGRLAGVRDCHVMVDAAEGLVVAYLAHTLVLPDARRTGLASLFRALPLTLVRREAASFAATTGDVDMVLAAEMEHADRTRPETLVRLVAYGRAGFAVVSPLHLPYEQPDFRDPAVIGEQAKPLPLLLAVRWIGRENAPVLPARLAAGCVRLLYDVFATHCRPEDLAPPRERALAALRRSGHDASLVPMPRSLEDDAAFRALSSAPTSDAGAKHA